MLTRRSLLKAVSGLPFVGRFVASVPSLDGSVVLPPGITVTPFRHVPVGGDPLNRFVFAGFVDHTRLGEFVSSHRYREVCVDTRCWRGRSDADVRRELRRLIREAIVDLWSPGDASWFPQPDSVRVLDEDRAFEFLLGGVEGGWR